MQADGIPDLAAGDDAMDMMVLDTIIDPCVGLWSAAEVQQTLGDSIDVVDAVARLHGIGLVHKLGEFVFPTRAAVRSYELPR